MNTFNNSAFYKLIIVGRNNVLHGVCLRATYTLLKNKFIFHNYLNFFSNTVFNVRNFRVQKFP